MHFSVEFTLLYYGVFILNSKMFFYFDVALFFATALFSSVSRANVVVSEGMFKDLSCASVLYPLDSGKIEKNNFKDNYFNNMKFSITKDGNGYKMTTDLYSGQFVDINESSSKLVFVQFYNGGTEVATIVVDKNLVTYTNTSGVFYNRLCVGRVVYGLNAH